MPRRHIDRERERPRLLNKQTDFIIISHARDSWDLHMYEYMYILKAEIMRYERKVAKIKY